MKWGGLVLALVACGPAAFDQSGSPLIYGADDRVEAFQAPEPWVGLALARGVALARDVEVDGEGRWLASPLGEQLALCPDEPFVDQPAPARCSGVLLDSSQVLTAGHCLAEGCEGLVIVRGFALEMDGRLSPIETHRCAEVVRRGRAPGLDYALITIEPPVGNLPPISMGTASLGLSVVGIGHPLGLPLKVDRGGTVLGLDDRTFTVDLDLYEGSSGSGVYDFAGGLLGVAAGGPGDLSFDPQSLCLRSRSSSVGQERITRIDAALADPDPLGPAPPDPPASSCRCTSSPADPATAACLLVGLFAAIRRRPLG